MNKYRLRNGITLLFERNSSNAVAVEVMFKVGSNHESKKDAGMAHFLEHMLFEGTSNRKSSREIANEIERYGAEFNAYTTGDRTAFFIKIVNSRFDNALDILGDMVANPLFDEKIMEKEKRVVCKEINMVTDDSRLHQWVLFEKELFEKHPVRNPTAGTAKSVTIFSRKQLVDYYTTHYLPNNMIISIVGNIDGVKKKVEKYFGVLKPGKLTKRPKVNEPVQKRVKKFVLRKRNLNSYMVLGYKTVPRTNKESYVFDVIAAVLGRGQSGWMFDEIRNKRGLAYQVGINNEQEYDYGFFAVYSGLDKTKIGKAQELIMQQIERLQNISKKDFDEAKSYIEGNHTLTMEDNFHKADNMAVWECIKDAKLTKSYLKSIKNVTVSDLKKVAKKYLNGKYTLVVIEQK